MYTRGVSDAPGPLGQKDSIEKGMDTLSVFMPGAFHGQRNLTGYIQFIGSKQLDIIEQLTLSIEYHFKCFEGTDLKTYLNSWWERENS